MPELNTKRDASCQSNASTQKNVVINNMGESIESNNSGDIVVTMRKRDEFKWISMGEEMVNRDLKKVVGSGVGNKFTALFSNEAVRKVSIEFYR